MSSSSFMPRLSFLSLLPPLLACSGPARGPAESAKAEMPAPHGATQVAPPIEVGPSPQEIKAVIDGSEPDVRQCYIAGTFKDSQLAGTVNVTFTIDPTGTVSQAADGGSSLPDPEVVNCVVNVFTQLVFRPGGSGPTEVTYPIRFGSRG